MTTIGMMKTRVRLLTCELPVGQHEAERRFVGDRGIDALLRDREAVLPADRDRDVLLPGAFEEYVSHVAFEGDVLDPRGKRHVCAAGDKVRRFRPHEQDRAVAGLE